MRTRISCPIRLGTDSRASLVHAPLARAFAERWLAFVHVALPTPLAQPSSASSSPSSSPSSRSIRSRADTMSLTLKSKATTSARSIAGSATTGASASASSPATRRLSRVHHARRRPEPQPPHGGSSSARSYAARSCTGSPCDTITCSNGRSRSARSAGSARSSCHGVTQTRRSPSGAVSASAKTSARCSGSQSGVSFFPRPS
jgi:hypothetical protein